MVCLQCSRSLALARLNEVVCSSVQLFATKTYEINPMLSPFGFPYFLISTYAVLIIFYLYTFYAAFPSFQSFPLNRGSVCLVIIP